MKAWLKTALLVAWILSVNLAVSAQEVEAEGSFVGRLNDATLELTLDKVVYDAAYYSMDYPMGDVPQGRGVCSDVVIRAYRALGIDLQKEVHEDMVAHFDLYPKIWGLSRTDTNIDHRRVPNLMAFFERNGEVKEISKKAADYLPGDIVCWNLGGAITHIGIVVDRRSERWDGYKVVHNIGSGQLVEDCLFDFRIIAHYIYTGNCPE